LWTKTKDNSKEVLQLHGVLVDVSGVGVLILGRSGIGKSECALELIMRGHRLVADDMVWLERVEDRVYGFGSKQGQGFMEIRGLGIVNVEKLFGVSALKPRKRVHLVVELVDPEEALDRTGLEKHFFEVMGVRLPLKRIPVTPGRNLSAIVEVAARSFLLEERGYDAPREFKRLLEEAEEE